MPQEQTGYDFASVQKKWNEQWLAMHIGRAEDFSKKPKKYALVELPYPSAAGLHMGHCWNYTLFDVYARYFRAKGFNVLYPMGWDSFGLPTYNHAIKVGRDPHEVSAENVATFRRQLQELGLAFDWDREIDTSSPEYYKWTQWIFVQMYEHWYDENFVRADGGKGQARPISDLPVPEDIKQQGIKAIKAYQDNYRIAYKAKMPVAWCPKCKTGLANEEVTAQNTHERCDTPVEQRELEQWMLRIRAYGDRLIDDLQRADFPNSVIKAQENWIKRSYGIKIRYKVKGTDKEVTVFTTRPETNFGATFITTAPDGQFVKDNIDQFPKSDEAKQYVATAIHRSQIEREAESKIKTGVFTGWYAINQLTGFEMPIYISDFVIGSYGTGSLVGVPGHDVRDFEFAKAMGDIEIKRVLVTDDGDLGPITSVEKVQEDRGTVVNSDFLNGMAIIDARTSIIEHMVKEGYGEKIREFKFHDWVFSRQHYWGEPTPLVYCEQCGWTPVPMSQLPVELPKLDDYKMGEDGSSPLERATAWKKTTCPTCGGEAQRETDVMPNWAGSNWYFLRYADPHNKEKLIDHTIAEYWMPVDIYYGGQEHVTLHLLYSRFVYKFLYDLGTVPHAEPYKSRKNHGIILGPDGRKMSKSWGNVVNPDDVVGKYGADVVRVYLMFIAPYDAVTPWNDRAVVGISRFVDRLAKFFEKQQGMVKTNQKNTENGEISISSKLSRLEKKISTDIETLKFNTAIAAFMQFMNETESLTWTEKNIVSYLVMLAPFTPYLAEEMWHRFGFAGSVHLQSWPTFDQSQGDLELIEIPVMVNGKVRARLSVSINDAEDKVVDVAMSILEVQKHIENGHKKVVYVPGKTVNFVV